MSVKDTEKLESTQLDVIITITTKLHELGLQAKFIKPVSTGPIVSIFRFMPEGATRVSAIEGLADDFAVALGVEDVFVKRLPGDSAVAVCVPNKERKIVKFIDTINNVWKEKDDQKIPLNFGVDQVGTPFVVDLVELPHLLVAGSTGSGKSTLLTSILASDIYCLNPERVQFILSDTKQVEFGHFIGAPNLLFEPATSVYQTLERFDWAINEMEARLKRYGRENSRNISENNEKRATAPDPYIVIIIDELADLIAYKGANRGESKLAEEKISKLAGKARASGIHIIASTQRPSVNVINGSIKANFPARLSFRLPTDADSRTVLGCSGAEHLLSKGDMLYVSPNTPGIKRLHSPYAEISDIKAAVDAASRR